MTIEQFATKWFTFYYLLLGLLFVCIGIALLIKTDFTTSYLLTETETNNPPSLLRTVLKYFLIFTIPGLVLAFFPFVWYEFLFAVWSLFMVFVVGQQLVRWPQTRRVVESNSRRINLVIRLTGVGMIVIGAVIVLLGYLELRQFLPAQ